MTSRTKLFQEYAILGDDIVIWNKTIAREYLILLDKLGVKVGIAKSILSPKSLGCEFAKKTFIKGVDVSPIPLKEASAAHSSMVSFISFMNRYSMDLLNGIRFLGYGYKVSPVKNTSTMQVFQLARSIPKTFEELLDLFFVESTYLDPSLSVQHERMLDLCNLLGSELFRLATEAKKEYYDTLQVLAGSFSSPVFNTLKEHEELQAVYLQRNNLLRQYLKVYHETWKTCDAMIDRLDPLLFKLHSIPDLGFFGFRSDVAWELSLRKSLGSFFDVLKTHMSLDKHQLLHPKMTFSDPDNYKSGLERKATLLMWNRWHALLKGKIKPR